MGLHNRCRLPPDALEAVAGLGESHAQISMDMDLAGLGSLEVLTNIDVPQLGEIAGLEADNTSCTPV